MSSKLDLNSFLTASQAAELVGVHVQTFVRWIDAKRVTGVKKHGTAYLVAPDFTILTHYSEGYLKRAVPLKKKRAA